MTAAVTTYRGQKIEQVRPDLFIWRGTNGGPICKYTTLNLAITTIDEMNKVYDQDKRVYVDCGYDR
jgi:hypothetical protein